MATIAVGQLDSARFYGANYQEPLRSRDLGKAPGGYAYDETSASPQRMPATAIEDSARISPGNLIHPMSSEVFWLLAMLALVLWLNGKLRTSRLLGKR